METKHKFPYRWTLKDANFTKDKGKVFSCFACGGGSTMGYKLAGFDVIGCNEIDPRMNKVYVENHHPKHNYLMDIRELVKMAKNHELPEELYNLDVLDGSPPCSTFSTSSVNRESFWGVEHEFREGQQSQILDELFFHFIELAEHLQPKVIIAENVKGLLMGEAYKYVKRIYSSIDKAGYYCKHFLLDAQFMGVPQHRERTFFVCLRNDLNDFVIQDGLFGEPKLDINFNEQPILFGDVSDYNGRELNEGTKTRQLWDARLPEDEDLSGASGRVFDKPNSMFSLKLYKEDKVAKTIIADTHSSMMHYAKPVFLSGTEITLCSTFPTDYNYLDQNVGYMCGMSVPPVMMAQVASRVYEQWLKPINEASND